jgi:hypothetical protein
MYLDEAVVAIDDVFGNGFAREHPEFVGAYMQAIALNNLAERLPERFEEVEENKVKERRFRAAGKVKETV